MEIVDCGYEIMYVVVFVCRSGFASQTITNETIKEVVEESTLGQEDSS